MFSEYDDFPIPAQPAMTPADRAFITQVEAMLDEPADPTDHEADRARRCRPNARILRMAKRMLAHRLPVQSDITVVFVPLAFPGKSRGWWACGQQVISPEAYFPVHAGDDPAWARNAAAAVARSYLEAHHPAGGSYAFVRVELDPTARDATGLSVAVHEDGDVDPRADW